jgi:putative FmdB family regulatory protein
MPTYQYACTAPGCGSRFELVQSFTEANASHCPTCGGIVRKVFSAVGVVFKGSGFYRNDSRKAAGKESSNSNSDSSAKTESAKSASPDTSSSADSAGESSSSTSAKAKKSSSEPSSAGSASGGSARKPSSSPSTSAASA